VAPAVLVHAEHTDPVQPARVVDQQIPTGGQDGGVGGVPGRAQRGGDAGDRERSITTDFNAHHTACRDGLARGAAAVVSYRHMGGVPTLV